MLHQDEGGIGKSIPSALQISLDPRDFPRASPSGNLSGLGKSFGRRGWISQYLPRLGGARIQCYPVGKDARLIHPCRMEHIDSVKINPSLVMMREWAMGMQPAMHFQLLCHLLVARSKFLHELVEF